MKKKIIKKIEKKNLENKFIRRFKNVNFKF